MMIFIFVSFSFRSSIMQVIVDFSANWCGPCKRIAPIYEELAKQHTNAVFLHVDVDDVQGLPDGSDISSIPCFKFFKGGHLVEYFVGGNADKLKELVNKLA